MSINNTARKERRERVEFAPKSFAERVGQYQPFVLEISKLAQAHPGVLSCALHGSRTLDTRYFSDTSDLDLVFIVTDQSVVGTVKEQIKQIQGAGLVPEHPDYLGGEPEEYWYYETPGQEVGLKFLTVDQIQTRIVKGYISVADYEGQAGFWQHVLMETLPIHDPQGLFSKVKEALYPMNEELRKAVLEKNLRLLQLRVEGARESFKNYFEEFNDIHSIILEIARVHYALNGVHIMKWLKQYDIDMQDFEPDITTEVQQLMQISPRQDKAEQRRVGREKRALIKTIYQKLLDAYLSNS